MKEANQRAVYLFICDLTWNVFWSKISRAKSRVFKLKPRQEAMPAHQNCLEKKSTIQCVGDGIWTTFRPFSQTFCAFFVHLKIVYFLTFVPVCAKYAKYAIYLNNAHQIRVRIFYHACLISKKNRAKKMVRKICPKKAQLLWFTGNDIGPDRTKALAVALKTNRTIQTERIRAYVVGVVMAGGILGCLMCLIYNIFFWISPHGFWLCFSLIELNENDLH